MTTCGGGDGERVSRPAHGRTSNRERATGGWGDGESVSRPAHGRVSNRERGRREDGGKGGRGEESAEGEEDGGAMTLRPQARCSESSGSLVQQPVRSFARARDSGTVGREFGGCGLAKLWRVS